MTGSTIVIMLTLSGVGFRLDRTKCFFFNHCQNKSTFRTVFVIICDLFMITYARKKTWHLVGKKKSQNTVFEKIIEAKQSYG